MIINTIYECVSSESHQKRKYFFFQSSELWPPSPFLISTLHTIHIIGNYNSQCKMLRGQRGIGGGCIRHIVSAPAQKATPVTHLCLLLVQSYWCVFLFTGVCISYKERQCALQIILMDGEKDSVLCAGEKEISIKGFCYFISIVFCWKIIFFLFRFSSIN